MRLTGAEIVIECLKEQGVDTVFGYPGGTILNIYDALYKHSDEIRHVLTSHEQGASHAADGYARATGKVGVCMATSGPGATNLVTGIATAYMDSVPMVAITANVNLPLLGKDTFQEVDIAGVTMPITKHGYIVKDVNILADTIRKAFQIAKSGRPGPVLVDITKDVTANTCEYTPVSPEEAQKVKRYTESDLEEAVSLIEKAERPFIYLGGGAIGKNIPAYASVTGDLKCVLRELNVRLAKKEHKEWMAHIGELQEKYPLKYNTNQLSCPFVIEEIDRVTKGEAVISTDVGQHQMWAAQYYKYTKPRTFLSSGGLGTMGYGLGACIGAKVGQPDKICINIAGDGCFRMNMNELATASRYNIPIIQVIINNHVLGMVRQWQTLFYDHRYSQTVLNDKVDFCKVSEGLGCTAIRVTKKEEFAPALEKAIAMQAPVVIECVIPEDDKVFPMVPAGAPISEAFDEDDLQKA